MKYRILLLVISILRISLAQAEPPEGIKHLVQLVKSKNGYGSCSIWAQDAKFVTIKREQGMREAEAERRVIEPNKFAENGQDKYQRQLEMVRLIYARDDLQHYNAIDLQEEFQLACDKAEKAEMFHYEPRFRMP